MKLFGAHPLAHPLLLVAALAVGCAQADNAVGASRGSGGSNGGSYSGGSSGSKGDAGISILVDAAAPKDASGSDGGATSNLSTDGPSFNWDTHQCSGCAGTGGGAPGTAGDAGGSTQGSGGSPTSADAGMGRGGMTGSGGSSASAGTGGAYGAGGALGGGGGSGSLQDAGIRVDAPNTSSDAVGSDLSRPMDAGGAGPDTKPADATVVVQPCSMQIATVIPALGRLDRLTAGASTKVVLRAEVLPGSSAPSSAWSWQATWEGSPLPVTTVGTKDPNAAMFTIANAGNYTFRATAGTCSTSVSGFAVAANACSSCDKAVILKAAPPATSNVPMQSGALSLTGSSPFSQSNLILPRGVAVRVSPSLGSSLVKSYVRINDTTGSLVVDGLADPQVGGLVTRLLALDNNLAALRYDVLVVPLDGSDGSTVAATAPQLFLSRDPTSLNGALPLSGGVTVTGTALSATGQPVADVRVMLTNQDPTSTAAQPELIFSSVGQSDAQGKYSLHVQAGTYWATFSPPPDSGLGDALAPKAVDLSAGVGDLSFQWVAATSAPLTLQVVDANGVPTPGVSVRVKSSQAQWVGTLTATPAGGMASAQMAEGNVQVEDTTDANGTASFAALPANQDYDVLLAPAAPGPSAATTSLTISLAAGGTSKTVALLAQANIVGQIVARAAALDYAGVTIVAYDRSSDSPEAPRAITASSDGSFALGVTPGRPYVVIAEPDIASGYARTFIGAGWLQSSEFTITQNLLTSMAWQATVMDDTQTGLGDTTLQVFCGAGWPGCVDANVPLAETTSDASGAFQLALPDPSSR